MTPSLDPTDHPEMTTVDVATDADAVDDADVRFLSDLLGLLHSAARLSDMAGSRSHRIEVRDLAALINTSQHRQIAAVATCLKRWGRYDGATPAETGSPMLGWMLAEVDTDRLAPLNGAAFDEDFLSMMLTHERAAVDRSRQEMVRGLSGEGRDLARTTVHEQGRDQRRIERLVGTLPPR